MALIKCSECKKEISDKAVTCPHCGAPVILEVVPKVDMAQKQREERHRKEKLDQEELEQIAKLPPAKRLAAERKRKERLENEEKNNRLGAYITLGVIIVLIVAIFRSCSNSSSSHSSREWDNEMRLLNAKSAEIRNIKKNMKNPDSFKEAGVSYGHDSTGRETMTIKYRGTNSFGGIVTEERTVDVEQ